MLRLIMEQNAQLKEMEAELEMLLKEKEQSKPMEVIPLSTVPLTGVSTTSALDVCPLILLEDNQHHPCVKSSSFYPG
jgi:hypothetical protein